MVLEPNWMKKKERKINKKLVISLRQMQIANVLQIECE